MFSKISRLQSSCHFSGMHPIYSVAYNPEQRWFYFPSLAPGEAMLLKCYDSMEDGRARFTAHSAFTDPTAPADASARESIEARTFAFFAPAA